MDCHLKCSGSRHNTLVLHSILHSSQSIVNGILYLSDGVLIGPWRERESVCVCVCSKVGQGCYSIYSPLIRIVTDLGLVTSSTNVYLSSP